MIKKIKAFTKRIDWESIGILITYIVCAIITAIAFIYAIITIIFGG